MISAKPKGGAHNPTPIQVDYGTGYAEANINREKSKPYCNSTKCISKARNIKLAGVSKEGECMIEKFDHKYTDTFCRDCGSALFWYKKKAY